MMGGFLAVLCCKSNGKPVHKAQICQSLPETVTIPLIVSGEVPHSYPILLRDRCNMLAKPLHYGNAQTKIMHN
jgi:hypothetical protein